MPPAAQLGAWCCCCDPSAKCVPCPTIANDELCEHVYLCPREVMWEVELCRVLLQISSAVNFCALSVCLMYRSSVCLTITTTENTLGRRAAVAGSRNGGTNSYSLVPTHLASR